MSTHRDRHRLGMAISTARSSTSPCLASDELDAGFSQLQWIVNGYTLNLAALILLGGSLGDRLGRRPNLRHRRRLVHHRFDALRHGALPPSC